MPPIFAIFMLDRKLKIDGLLGCRQWTGANFCILNLDAQIYWSNMYVLTKIIFCKRSKGRLIDALVDEYAIF